MDRTIEVPTPAADLARQSGQNSQRECGVPRRAQGASGRGNRAATQYRTRRSSGSRFAAWGRGFRDYRFRAEEDSVAFADLFDGTQTLAAYSFMFGPERERPCPMCTNLLDPWDSNALRPRAAYLPRRHRPLADRASEGLEAGKGRSTNSIPRTPGAHTSTKDQISFANSL